MKYEPAPIAIFAYNRLYHLRQTISSLKTNPLANLSELFIFSDGPRNRQDRILIRGIRRYIRTIHGFKKITLHEAKTNKGLSQSIISGINTVLEHYPNIIVLEDDICVSQGFLQYMNEALEIYKADRRVMHINGYMYPIRTNDIPDTFFYNQMTCWGWGTWRRAWSKYNNDSLFLYQQIMKKKLDYSFNIDDTNFFTQDLITRKIWDINWYASIHINHGFCLYPKISLVNNIGFDHSGIHCGYTTYYENKYLAQVTRIEKVVMKEHMVVRERMKKYYLFQKSFFYKLYATWVSLTEHMRQKYKSFFPEIML